MKVIRFILFLFVFLIAIAIIDIAFKALFVLGFAGIAYLSKLQWYWLTLAVIPAVLLLTLFWHLLKSIAVYSTLLISRVSPYNNKATTMAIDWIVLLNTIYLIYGAWMGVEGEFTGAVIVLCIIYTLCAMGLYGAFIRASKALDTILMRRDLKELKESLQ